MQNYQNLSFLSINIIFRNIDFEEFSLKRHSDVMMILWFKQ